MSKFQPFSLEELMLRKFPESRWLVEGLIPEAGITAISGTPASFKTWVHLFLARSVASGLPLFEKFPVKHTGVLIIDEENGERELQQRFKVIDHEPLLPIYMQSLTGFKLLEKTTTELLVHCAEKEIGLVIFDSLVRINAGGDENDALKMATVFQAMKRLTVEGITVVFIHHNRKPSNFRRGTLSFDMRGSSDILAAVDCHIAIERDHEANTLTLNQTKLRSAEELKPFTVSIIKGEVLELVYGAEVNLQTNKQEEAIEVLTDLLGAAETPLTQSDIQELLIENGLSIGQKALRNALTSLVEAGSIAVTVGTRGKKLFSVAEKPGEVALSRDDQ
ncbi:AAA family ATPase [Candidatus Berkelbacteria bacterium]|nr:AAA family ATPase [Candidatus Berkelbacteria bacterium]